MKCSGRFTLSRLSHSTSFNIVSEAGLLLTDQREKDEGDLAWEMGN